MDDKVFDQLATTTIPRRKFVKRISTAGMGLIAAFDALKISSRASTSASSTESLPVDEIEEILQTSGHFSDGVLSATQDRPDLGTVIGPLGIPFKVGFQVENGLFFQSIGNGKAIFNGDVSILAEHTQDVIDRMLQTGLIYQAFHQHYIDMRPQVWFMHFRGIGDPIELAKKVLLVVEATRTPLPQNNSGSSTPLDVGRLEEILQGRLRLAKMVWLQLMCQGAITNFYKAFPSAHC